MRPPPSPAALNTGLVVLAFVAYVSLGLPDGLLGVAWPSMRRNFTLNHDSLGTLMLSITAGYLTSSFFGGRLLAHFRLGTLLAASTLSAGLALFAYAAAPGWTLLTAAGIAAGLGGGGIDVTLNLYVVEHHGDRLMQWLHASYGVGATAGPMIMTTAIILCGNWRWGYMAVGTLQCALALCFSLTLSLWDKGGNAATAKAPARGVSMSKTLCLPAVWQSLILFFLYMGVEVAFGAWSYSLLTESRGMMPRLAGYATSSFWGLFTVGRILAGLYAPRVPRTKLVAGSILAALFGTLILSLDINALATLGALTIIGLAIAPILPALLSGTEDRVGSEYSGNTIGIQIAAMSVGGATIPALTGIIAERHSLEAIPIFMMLVLAALLTLYLIPSKAGKEKSPAPAKSPSI